MNEQGEMMQIEVKEDGGFFVVRMPPEAFMAFFGPLVAEGVTIVLDNRTVPKRKRGRPSKEEFQEEGGGR